MDAPAFNPDTLRGLFRTPEARAAFDRGRESSERRLEMQRTKEGCDCPRCLSNEDYRVRFARTKPGDQQPERTQEYTFGQ